MLGGVGGLLRRVGGGRVGAARRAEAPAAARRHLALRTRQPAPPRARVEPADRRACARPDGAAAADRRARRPDAQLAREPAARCAQPVPRQRAARPGGRRARAAAGAHRRASTPPFKPMVRGRLVESQRRRARHGASSTTRARDGWPSASSTCRGPTRCRRAIASSPARSGSRRRAAPKPASRSRTASPRRSASKLGDTLTFDIAGIARDRPR